MERQTLEVIAGEVSTRFSFLRNNCQLWFFSLKAGLFLSLASGVPHQDPERRRTRLCPD